MAYTGQAYMQGIESLRNVEWSRSYTWDCCFYAGALAARNPAPPAPFDTWFPAIDITETAHTSNTMVMPFFISQYKFAQTQSSTDIMMQFHDDQYGTLYKWMSEWFLQTYDDTDGVAMLQDCYRQLNIMKLDQNQQTLMLYQYFVIPEGAISEMLSSMADTKTYSVQFAVIGRLDPIDMTSFYNDELNNDFGVTDQQNATQFDFKNLG